MTRRLPPGTRIARWLLARILSPAVRDDVLLDLAESDASGRAHWREVLVAPRSWSLSVPATAASPHLPETSMSRLLADIRFSWRVMMRRKGMTMVAVLTLAIGTGASTAIFSAVYPILVRTLPYPDADRLMMIWERDGSGQRNNVGFQTFDDLARSARSFESMAAMGSMAVTMTTEGEPYPFVGQRVTPGFFRVLGVEPALGRGLRAEDDQRGTPNVVVLSHVAWRDAFGSAPDILDRPVVLDGVTYRVIGVMPEGFESAVAPEARIWTPLRYEPTLDFACRSCRHLRVIARRHPHVSAEDAERELEVLAANLHRDHPGVYTTLGFRLQLVSHLVTERVRPALVALMGAVLLVLLVATLNVSSLLLARGASRRGEFAVRIALGAGRGRLVRQLLTESLVLALLGGAAGIVVAVLGVRGLVAISPADVPRLGAIRVNGAPLLFAAGLTTVAAIIFGLVPALQGWRAGIGEGLRGAARSVTGADRRMRAGVVIGEVALALVLLVGAGLLVRSTTRLLAVDPGFETERLLTAQVQAGAGDLRTDTLVARFFAGALDAVRGLPGVRGAAFTSQLPLSGDFDGYGIRIESQPPVDPTAANTGAFRYAVSPGYFEVLGIPSVAGRTFTAADDDRGVRVAIVSEGFARRHLPGLDPLRQRIRVGGSPDAPWREVVGVVGDVRQVSLEDEQVDAVYVPEAQWQFVDATRSLVVRAESAPMALVPGIRAAIWSVNKDQPILRVIDAASLVRATAAERRFAMLLFQGFAIVALVLAAAGIYGVLIGSVAERTRELGVRAALGASRRDLILMIVRQGMALTTAGIVVGIALALLGSRALTGLLYGVSALDPLTYLAVAAGLALVALLASWVPARRAAGVDPAETLRSE